MRSQAWNLVDGGRVTVTTAARAMLLIGVLGTAAQRPAAGQVPAAPDARPWIAELSHWGRWVTLAGAAGLIAAAVARHEEAQGALDQLDEYCRPENPACRIVVGPDGRERYQSDEAEELYRVYADIEKRARGFLLGGQVSLLAAGTMFLIDLIHGTEDTDNIPYTPLQLYTRPNRLGLALYF